ncbi:MAG: AMP-binding protein [Alphaproteobacteria bacterium]
MVKQADPHRPPTVAALFDALAAYGESPALMTVREGAVEAISFAALHHDTRRLATGLLKAGLARGEGVVLYGANSPAWITVRGAVALAGGKTVALDHLTPVEEATRLIKDAGAGWVLADAGNAAALRALLPGESRLFRLADGRRSGDGETVPSWRSLLADEPAPLPEIDADNVDMLVYTSGTTGAPKGIELTHRMMMANVTAICAEGLVGPGDRALLPLPLHHVYPGLVGLLVPLTAGTAVVLPEAVTGPGILEALRLAEGSVVVGVPRLYGALLAGIESRIETRGRLLRMGFRAMLAISLLLRRRLGISVGRCLFGALHRQFAPRLRLLACGGAHLDIGVHWKLEALGWRVVNGYGLAETASIFTVNFPGARRIGSEGRPLGGGGVRIADPDVYGIGEIQLRGASVFAGYRNNPDASREAFTADGWFRTGDLGHIDRDGFLHVAGRLTEMIVLGGGKNVFPEDVEAVYGDNPLIADIAVLERDGVLVALVLPDFAAIAESGNTQVDSVIRVELATLSRRLPSWQRIAGYAIVRAPLPKTRLGKVRRFLLPEIYDTARSGGAAATAEPLAERDRDLLATEPAGAIWQWLASRYAARGVTLDTNPQLDLGIDSLGWMEIAIELDERFDVRLTEDQVAGIVTLRDLLSAAGAPPSAVEPTPGPSGPVRLTAEQRRWTTPMPAPLAFVAALVLALNRWVMRLVFRIEVRGLENLPARGPYMLAPNHASYLDAPAIAGALPFRIVRQIRWGGDARKMFSSWFGRLASRGARIFPINERAPQATLALAGSLLEKGHILVWFPEAWRTPDGRLQAFMPGVGTLLQHSGVLAVPVHIQGTFEAWPRDRRLPRVRRLRIVFGRPVTPATLSASGSGQTPEARIAEALHDAVAALAEPNASIAASG